MMASTTAASNAVLNPSILKPGTMLLITRSNIALITNVNNPSVRMLIGSVRMTSIGLIMDVSMPQTIEMTNSICHPPIVIPGTRYAVV